MKYRLKCICLLTFMHMIMLTSAGEYQEVQASTGPITKVCVCCNDTILLTAGEDGVLMVFDVRDKERAIASSILRREKDAMTWADEVLVPKGDLEDMKGHVQELEQMVW